MFITLTDADNGQAVDIRADQVQVVRILDHTHTEVVLAAGVTVEVREAPRRVLDAIGRALGLQTMALPPRAGFYERGA